MNSHLQRPLSLSKVFQALPRAASLSLLLGLASHGSAFSQISDGPSVQFKRQGPRVCAQYALNGSHDLYKNHLFARTAGRAIPIEGLPKGLTKKLAGTETVLIAQSFSACAVADNPEASLVWIDQSCLNKEALCLAPRAFEISGTGKATLLDPEKSGALFALSLSGKSGAPSTQTSDGWGSWTFGPKK